MMTRGHGEIATFRVAGGGPRWRLAGSCLGVGTEPRAVLVTSPYSRPLTANRFICYGEGRADRAPSDDRAGHPYLLQLGQHAVLTLPRGVGLD